MKEPRGDPDPFEGTLPICGANFGSKPKKKASSANRWLPLDCMRSM